MTLTRYIPAIAAALLFASCSSDEADTTGPATANAVSIGVSTDTWQTPGTRATYSAATENKGDKIFPTTLTSGDAIGVYVVDATGKVTVANKKYTFDGTAWNTDTPMQFADSLRDSRFYAYYPYQASLTGAPALGDNAGLVADTTFFKNAISGWTVQADQGTLASFAGSDLMTGLGTTAEPYVNELHISFTIHHRMGLLITKDAWTVYYEDKPDSTWTQAQTFTGNIPYAIGDEKYYFVKPGVATTLGSKTTTVSSGEVEQLYFNNGEPLTRK